MYCTCTATNLPSGRLPTTVRGITAAGEDPPLARHGYSKLWVSEVKECGTWETLEGIISYSIPFCSGGKGMREKGPSYILLTEMGVPGREKEYSDSPAIDVLVNNYWYVWLILPHVVAGN